jgi:hypothetical protein
MAGREARAAIIIRTPLAAAPSIAQHAFRPREVAGMSEGGALSEYDSPRRGSFSGLRIPLRDRSSSYTSQRTSTQSELFLDMTLIFSLQNMFALPITPVGLAHLCLFYALLWNAWVGIAFFNTRFDTDDLISRAFAVCDMVAVVGMSLAIPTANVQVFVIFYMSIRVLLVVKYMRVWLSVPYRFVVNGFILGFSSGVACWVSVLALPADATTALGTLVGCAILCDYGTPFALLRWMPPVNASHFPERLAGMIVLMFCGTLFNFVQSLPSPLSQEQPSSDRVLESEPPVGDEPPTRCNWFDFLSFTAFGILIAFGHILLAMRLPGPDMAAFSRTTWTRLRIYVYFYLQMPLGLAAMVMSTSVGSVAAAVPNSPSAEHLCVFALSCGLVHVLLAPLHVLAADRNHRRALSRATFGVLIGASPLFGLASRPLLGYVVVCVVLEVVLDHLIWMDATSSGLEGSEGWLDSAAPPFPFSICERFCCPRGSAYAVALLDASQEPAADSLDGCLQSDAQQPQQHPESER